MSEQIKYWETIIDEYRASGLSQPVFCKQNELSLNQFQYRWSQHNLAKQAETNSSILQNNAVVSSFEPITITPVLSEPKDAINSIAELAIHLPNRIRCDVKMDLRTEAFAKLLKQLVALC
jgi:hypothetical protein